MKLIRTFHPVGQGAFYSEEFFFENNPLFAVVYDCGTKSRQMFLRDEIDALRKRVSDIEVLFISHFHSDHISQIPYLLERFAVKSVVLPCITPAAVIDVFWDNYIDQHAVVDSSRVLFLRKLLVDEKIDNTHLIRVRPVSPDNRAPVSDNSRSMTFKDLLQINDYGDHEIESNIRIVHDGWEYIPCNYPCSGSNRLSQMVEERYPELYNLITSYDFEGAMAFMSAISFKEISGMYQNAFGPGEGENEESMVVLSCPKRTFDHRNAYCLYTGDAPFRDARRLGFIKEYFGAYWDRIGTLQVPHHGADQDSPQDLYDTYRTCVFCYGTNNTHGHPGRCALSNMAASKSIIKPVTEDPASGFRQEINTLGETRVSRLGPRG